jgi:hypothetical protein
LELLLGAKLATRGWAFQNVYRYVKSVIAFLMELSFLGS